jgi:hypothetical protein
VDEERQVDLHHMKAGHLLDAHWDEIRELLPNEIRHTLGAEIAKARSYRTLARRRECGEDDGSTVCVRKKGHPFPHRSVDGRQWI